MEQATEIKNIADTVYFSTIWRDMFCEHRLKGHGLIWIESGFLLIESPKFRLEAGPGSYVFWRRDCTATLKKLPVDGTPFRGIAINLSRDFLKTFFAEHLASSRLPSKVGSIPTPAVRIDESANIATVFDQLKPFENDLNALDENVLHEILNRTTSKLLQTDSRYYPTLFDFYETWKIDLMDFMEKHFTEDLSMSEFATYTGRSLATFKRDFEKISTLSPERWVMEQRLVLARHLMKDKGMLPNEALLASGFKNRSHFSASFKRRFGCSPTQLLRNSGVSN